MIIVTGGAGFIGSCLIARLNAQGHDQIIVVDALGHSEKWKNLRRLRFSDYLDKSCLFDALKGLRDVEAIIHLGACSDTTQSNAQYLMENNTRYTVSLAQHALHHDIRFIYASSAATYGGGEHGYMDDEHDLAKLEPLNMYGYSKHLFDLKAHRQGWFSKIVGLKFFNVFGPNEYHKGHMRSVVFNAVQQIRETGSVNLFKSHRDDFPDGGQKRDFIYVKEALDILLHAWHHPELHGLFNAGTGTARTFRALASAIFKALKKPESIAYIDMPQNLRHQYQYFTQADMSKLQRTGYTATGWDLETSVRDYVRRYLDHPSPAYASPADLSAS